MFEEGSEYRDDVIEVNLQNDSEVPLLKILVKVTEVELVEEKGRKCKDNCRGGERFRECLRKTR